MKKNDNNDIENILYTFFLLDFSWKSNQILYQKKKKNK